MHGATPPENPGLVSSNQACDFLSAARREADRHKWIESEKHGRDLGEPAIKDWYKFHYPGWHRERLYEHVAGICPWDALDRGNFGLLNKLGPWRSTAEKLLSRIREGGENLDILLWSREQGMPQEVVLRLLMILDINAQRIDAALLDRVRDPHGCICRVLLEYRKNPIDDHIERLIRDPGGQP